jgi:hypothetical protein
VSVRPTQRIFERNVIQDLLNTASCKV